MREHSSVITENLGSLNTSLYPKNDYFFTKLQRTMIRDSVEKFETEGDFSWVGATDISFDKNSQSLGFAVNTKNKKLIEEELRLVYSGLVSAGHRREAELVKECFSHIDTAIKDYRELEREMFERYVIDVLRGSGKKRRLQSSRMYGRKLKSTVYTEDLDQLEYACRILEKEKKDVDVYFQGRLIGRDILPEEIEVGAIEILGKYGLLQKQLNRELQTSKPYKLAKKFFSEEKISLFGHLQPTYRFCEAYIPKILKYLEALLSDSILFEFNQPIQFKFGDEKVQIPLREALEYEGVRLRPKNSNPTTSYFLEIVPDIAPTEDLQKTGFWDNPKYLRKDGYAVVAEISLNGRKVYDRELALRAFDIIEEVSGRDVWLKIKENIENGKILESLYPSRIRIEEEKTKIPEETKEKKKVKLWPKILFGIGALATLIAGGLKLYYSTTSSPEKELKERGNEYPLTMSALTNQTNSTSKITHSFNSLLPLFSNYTISDEQAASFISSHPPLVRDDGINATDAVLLKYWIKQPGTIDRIIQRIHSQNVRLFAAKEIVPQINKNLTIKQAEYLIDQYRNYKELFTKPNLLLGDFDKDGINNYNEIFVYHTDSTNLHSDMPKDFKELEQILFPIQNDTSVVSHVKELYALRIPELQKIVNGCLGNDSELQALGLNSSQIIREYRVNTIASGAINKIIGSHLNSSWPLIGIDLDKNCIRTRGKPEPSNDLTVVDKIVGLYWASSSPERLNLAKENPWRLAIIQDSNGYLVAPSLQSWFNSTKPPYQKSPYQFVQDVGVKVYPERVKIWNAVLDGRLNETRGMYYEISDEIKKELIPTFDFFWKHLSKQLENETYVTFAVSTAALGELTGCYWPPKWREGRGPIFLAHDGNAWSGYWTNIGLIKARELFEEINSTRPETLTPKDFIFGYDVIDYMKDNYGSGPLGCQWGSTLTTKVYISSGEAIPITYHFKLFNENTGKWDGHFGCIVKFKNKLIWSTPRVCGDSSKPYFWDVEGTAKYWERIGETLKGCYILDTSRERNPFVVLYEES